MKDIREIYPRDDDSDYFWTVSDYQPMLESWGYDILIQVDDADYQGDSRLLMYDGKRYGYLNFGWGSCSGCDALQACDSYEEIETLRDDLHEQIKWGSCIELLDFFEHHDWEGDYTWHADEQKTFIEQVKTHLKGVCGGNSPMLGSNRGKG